MRARFPVLTGLIGLTIAAASGPGRAAAQPADGSPVATAPGAPAPVAPSPAPSPSIDSILQGVATPPPPAANPATVTVPNAAPAAPPAAAPAPTVPMMSPAAMAAAYDSALRGAAQSAQLVQGPLDGGWTVFGRDGERLYRLQIADRGLGLGLAEGAWRDLKTNARLLSSGFIANVAYDGAQLTMKFYQSDANDLVVMTVRPMGGAWSGQLMRRGVATAVTFRRN